MKHHPWQTAAFVCLIAACAGQLACSGPGNTGRKEPPAELVAAVPWTNGVIPQRQADGRLVTANEPVYPPIGRDTPDPGSRPVDCSALSDIELSPYWVQTFEADPSIQNSVGISEAWSSYDDETKGAFRVPGDASWYPGLAGRYVPERWGLAADRITNGPSCDGQPNDWAFHFRGGRFNYFGAGAEHPLAAPFLDPLNPTGPACPPGSDLCSQQAEAGAVTDPVGLPIPPPPDGSEPTQRAPNLYWDLSLYDGITFWARRGPDGQPGLLVALQDKHTSDALNRGNQTFCRRIKPCRIKCQNGSTCAPENPDAPSPTYRCVDPTLGVPPIPEQALIEELYPVCGPTACRSPIYYRDPDFHDLGCKPYEFSGSQANTYCFGSEPPPLDEERCGDAWTAPIHMSTDWQLYAIPFTEFRQVGFAKRAPFLDLHSINMIALQFPVGFADVYVDNVSFYRRRR